MSENIEIDLAYEPEGAISATLTEWTDHIQAFIESPEYDYHLWFNDKSKVIDLIYVPLKTYWNNLSSSRQLQLHHGLKYLLNTDEHIPYVTSGSYYLEKWKRGSTIEKYYSSYQHIIGPQDGYALCEWMWEILFPDEDWHTDVSNWKLVNKSLM